MPKFTTKPKRACEKAIDEIQKLTEQMQAQLVESDAAITVLNSLSFERKTLIPLPEGWTGAQTQQGQPLPVWRTDNKAVAMAVLPPCGGVTVLPAEPETTTALVRGASVTQTDKGFVMENEHLKAVVDQKGEVISFKIAGSEREFAAGAMNHLQFYKDVPRLFDAWDIDSNYVDQEIEGARQVSVQIEEEGARRLFWW